jgi:hypothetical protein
MPKTTKSSTKKVRNAVAPKVSHASSTVTPSVTREDVALHAFSIYLAEGCPDGRHLEHWTRAEQELGFAG